METITLNKSIGRTRRETLGGKEYIVAPLSMLVPGVLNGSRGPLLYPPELVNRNPAVWNHMPIVVYHPMEMGKPTSARDPYILNKQGIGFVFKSRENGKAEGWFDVENTKRVDPRVYDALVKGQPMELSTGLFTKNVKAAPGANFRGKKYVEVVNDFTPDHLAILPDQKGACSLKDGCGMLINKSNKLSALDKAQQIIENFNPLHPLQPRKKGKFVGETEAKANDGAATNSHETIKQMQEPGNTTELSNKLSQIVKNQNSEGSQFGKPHNIKKEMPNMAKQRQVQNEEPIELTEDDRAGLIEVIVGNCDCEEATDAEVLNSLSDKTLSRLALNAMPPQMMKGKKKVVAEEEEPEEEMVAEEEVPVKNQACKGGTKGKPPVKKDITVNKTREDSPHKLDPQTQFLVNYAERKMQEEKDVLIEKLIANLDDEDKDAYSETLNEESIDKLEMMVKLLPKEEKREPVQNQRNGRMRSSIREEQSESRGRNFTGAGGALPKSQARQVNNSRNRSNEDEDPLSGPMESPTINYAEIAGFSNGTFIHRNNLGSMASSN